MKLIQPDCPTKTSGGRLHRFSIRSLTLRATLVSISLLVPCFWQPRIEAGDLSSHIYNTWLVQLIKQGKAPGLWISPQTTNVLFDYTLSALSSIVGFAAAQRIAVSLSVLVFFWSVFALISAMVGRRPWWLVPLIGMLTYGVIFCLGLFNYYISLALSFLTLTCFLRPSAWRISGGLAFLTVAWLAQPLPPLWTICTICYISVAKRTPDRYRAPQFLLAILLLIGLRQILIHSFTAIWSSHQILYITGVDQVVTFGRRYWLIFSALLTMWAVLFRRIGSERGFFAMVRTIPVQLYFLSVVGAFILPSAIRFPAYNTFYGGITQRLSLIAGVLACVIVGEAIPSWSQIGFLSLVASGFFALMYVDAAAMNRLERRVETVVSQLPPNTRVIGAFQYPNKNGLDISMVLDRACIGKCFSYGNYEPSTRQFRVRADPDNSIVMWDSGISAQRQYPSCPGAHSLREIYACGPDLTDLCVRAL